jgi:hypothetical protein
MRDADPVDAAFALAHNALLDASREPGLTETAGRWLARALEHAIQGLFVAWDYPVLAQKVQRHFESVMAAHVQPADADLIRAVWEDEGHSHPDLDLNTVIAACAAVVDRLETLADLPACWMVPPPVPPSIGWAALSRDDRRLLARVRQSARALCAEARVVLFGSRAKGLGGPYSDYDLLLVLPDDIDPHVRALIMSNVYNAVREAGGTGDHEYVTLST